MGPELTSYVEGLPDAPSNPTTIEGIESDMNTQINNLGLGFTYQLTSNNSQDYFEIQLGNIQGKGSESISFDGTTGATLQAVNNYIYLRMQDPNGEFYLLEEDLPGYDSTDTAILQEDINQAISDLRI